MKVDEELIDLSEGYCIKNCFCSYKIDTVIVVGSKEESEFTHSSFMIIRYFLSQLRS